MKSIVVTLQRTYLTKERNIVRHSAKLSNNFARSRRHIWSLSHSNNIRTHNHLVRKQTINHLAHLAKGLSCCECEYLYVRCIWLYVIIMSRTSLRVNPDSIARLNFKKHFAWSRGHIWTSTDSNEIQTHNHLVRKRTGNNLAKVTKWLSWVARTYMYGALDCMLFWYHVRVSGWIHSL